MLPFTCRVLYSAVMRWVVCHCIAQTRAYRLVLALRSELHAVRGVGLLAVVFLCCSPSVGPAPHSPDVVRVRVWFAWTHDDHHWVRCPCMMRSLQGGYCVGTSTSTTWLRIYPMPSLLTYSFSGEVHVFGLRSCLKNAKLSSRRAQTQRPFSGREISPQTVTAHIGLSHFAAWISVWKMVDVFGAQPPSM